MTLKDFISALKKVRDPKRALWDAGYHKSTREHWGIKVPDLEPIVKEAVKKLDESQLLILVQELWNTGIFDLMISAARILADTKVSGSKEVWTLVKSFMKDVDGWALEDTLARAAWKCIDENPRLLDELDKWSTHKNFWMRRAVLIFTLPFAKPGKDPKRMLGWAAQYANDREWFIQKAIGWWLRDLGAHNPERVIQFLNDHWDKLQYVAKKESTRKLGRNHLEKIHLFQKS